LRPESSDRGLYGVGEEFREGEGFRGVAAQGAGLGALEVGQRGLVEAQVGPGSQEGGGDEQEGGDTEEGREGEDGDREDVD
jgi:hypothetical protein